MPNRTASSNGAWSRSVGLQAYGDDNPAYYVVENHSPNARYAMVEKLNGAWQVQLLAVPYDHAAAAKLALQNGRPDWAVALMHGRISAEPPPV